MCLRSDDPRVLRFNACREIIGAPSLVTDYVFARVEALYPNLFALVSDPERWRDPPDWLGKGAARLKHRTLHAYVVEAPLRFGASFMRVECDEGGPPATLFVLNASFLAMVRHALSTAQGSGLSPSEFAALLGDMRDDPTRLREGPAPTASLDIVVPGIAWLLAHELGHAVGGEMERDEELQHVPAWCRSSVARELDADLIGFRLLQYCIQASPDISTHGRRLRETFDGIEAVLRGRALLHAFETRRATPFDGFPDWSDQGEPSPTLRWRALAPIKEACNQLGLLGNAKPGNDVFQHWDATVQQVLDEGKTQWRRTY